MSRLKGLFSFLFKYSYVIVLIPVVLLVSMILYYFAKGT
jgi:hypothetical protein